MSRWLPLLLLLPSLASAQRWQMQYFYDEDRSNLVINDLRFASPRRGVAVGYIAEKTKNRPTAVVTSDGGAHWTVEQTKETGLSLFFLDESLGWMVTPHGLWQTEEAGRNWHKVGKLPPLVYRVYFLDRQRGWAAGGRKSVFETTDGGKSWKKVAAAEAPKANPLYTSYTWIEFANKEVGMITGANRPLRRDDTRLPDWIEPDKAVRRREWPNVTISLETRNGGKTWSAAAASMFGNITRVRLLPDGKGLGLISYQDAFEWPSEVFKIDWKAGKMVESFRAKDRSISDVFLLPDGTGYLAGSELVGKLHSTPIPGKLKILTSQDLAHWKEMPVDYRAIATRAILAASQGQVWVATDTGMILKLAP